MTVRMGMSIVFVMVAMIVRLIMMFVPVVVFVVMLMFAQVNIEFNAFDGRLLFARHVEVITLKLELSEFFFQLARIDAEIDQRADEHVAAEAAEDVEIKRFHEGWASALIWLAA